ncbi:C-type lectin domain family 17, member A-like [Cherax quadricarinatus]
MKTLVVLAATVVAVAAIDECPGIYIPVGTSCYFFSESMKNWNESLTYCEEINPGGYTSALAHVDQCSQLGALAAYIGNNLDVVDYWIGGTDEEKEGVYRWHSTGDLIPVEVPFWYPGQPDGYVSENHLSLSKTGYFADEKGSLLQKFICQLL